MLPLNYQCEGQMTVFDYLNVQSPPPQSGRTLSEHFPREHREEQTSDVCLKNWRELKNQKFQYLCLKAENGCPQVASLETHGALHGEPTMPSIGESHKGGEEYPFCADSMIQMQLKSCFNTSEKPTTPRPSKLSDILETDPDPRYFLSAKACLGILRRAEERGKELPDLLERVLRKQAGLPVDSDSNGQGTYSIEGNGTRASHHGSGIGDGAMFTLNATEQHAVCIGNGQVHDAISPSDEISKTLNCMVDPMKVLVEPKCVGNGQLAQARLQDQVGTLNCMHDQQAVITPVVEGFDAYNQTSTGDVSKPLTHSATDSDHIPCVAIDRGSGGGNADTVNALCASDWRGISNQYVSDGKCIIQEVDDGTRIRKSSG